MDYINIAPRHEMCEERKVLTERAERMRAELESMDIRLEEERKRSAELLLQVIILNKISSQVYLNGEGFQYSTVFY